MDFDYDLTNEIENDAPTAGYPNVNYGRVTLSAQIVSWQSGEMVKRNPEKGKPLREGEYGQYTFTLDIAEFNPALEWAYERNVDVKKSSPRTQTNWTEIVEPSLIAVFGKEWKKPLSKRPYVLVEDVLDIAGKTSKKSGKVLTTIRFLKVFKNKAECEADRTARFTKRDNGAVPDNSAIPANIIKDVKDLFANVNEKEAKSILEKTKPYSDYDVMELIEAAGMVPF